MNGREHTQQGDTRFVATMRKPPHSQPKRGCRHGARADAIGRWEGRIAPGRHSGKGETSPGEGGSCGCEAVGSTSRIVTRYTGGGP